MFWTVTEQARYVVQLFYSYKQGLDSIYRPLSFEIKHFLLPWLWSTRKTFPFVQSCLNPHSKTETVHKMQYEGTLSKFNFVFETMSNALLSDFIKLSDGFQNFKWLHVLCKFYVKISTYFTDHPVTAVYGNDHCLLWVS